MGASGQITNPGNSSTSAPPAGGTRGHRRQEGPGALALGIPRHGGELSEGRRETSHESAVNAHGGREGPRVCLGPGQSGTSLHVRIERNGNGGEDPDNRHDDYQSMRVKPRWLRRRSRSML